ncbi:MAG TPA: hypothetical protein VF054_15755 [Micromonosporaceae bacterium]
MRDDQVVDLLDGFARVGVRVWIGGGWGVDAMLGRQTRDHGDLDLAVDAEHLDTALRLLTGQGFTTTTDWLPVRVELTGDDGQVVDLHPITFAADGSATQPGLDGARFDYAADAFTVGRIAGHPVPCLSVRQQLQFRQGYPPRPVDVHDVALLRSMTGDR